MEKKICCVILNYNDSSTTERLALKVDKYPCFHHIIIVDNKSTDGSLSRLRKLQRTSNKYVLLESPKNGGYGYGNNIAIRYIRDHYNDDCFIIANPDVDFSEAVVESLVSFMRTTKDCAIVSAVQNNRPDRSGWREANIIEDQLFNSIILNKLFKPRYYSLSYFQKDVVQLYAISGCFFLARMKPFFEIGLYDEDFFLYEEEKCIAYKLQKLHWKTYLLTKLSFTHDHSVSIDKSLKKLGQSKKLVLQSNRLYLEKYLGLSKRKIALIRIYHYLCELEQIIWDFIRWEFSPKNDIEEK